MKTKIFTSAKYALAILSIALCNSITSSAQQNVIADKDNTHPEINTLSTKSAFINSFTAQHSTGYNDISWSVSREENTRRYIVEYSTDGIDFRSAGEVIAGNSNYTLRHSTNDDHAFIYRIKAEQMNGKFSYSNNVKMIGAEYSPVKIYPTVITGNTVNIIASMPVERIDIYSTSGALVYAKDVNGQRDNIPVVIPSIGKGIYTIAFAGQGWKSSKQFIVQ